MYWGDGSLTKRALIVQGGWEGHQPREVADVLAGLLKDSGFQVDIEDNLDIFAKVDELKAYQLIVPNWTQGDITKEQLLGLTTAVRDGVGLAGLHGGLGDSFRSATEYQFMVGGQWVAHPGNDGVTYDVEVVDSSHEITRGLTKFTVTSEQYYMHVDPAIHVLAITRFGDVEMPVAWTKMWGSGRVFYCSLGHTADIVRIEEVSRFMKQGMVWAASQP